MKMIKVLVITLNVFFFIDQAASQPATIRQYLSGQGYGDTVTWDFKVSDGRRSEEWAKIPVPSCWELEGFGTYNYGHAKDAERGKEIGHYKHQFTVPDDWKGKQIEIVFEGSMTDTEVRVNGKLAGELHQGSFYCFKYDISKLIMIGQSNLLEVTVSKHSANESVNKAERYADYWIFGGIFRPVFLEAKPVQNIERVAVDAKADGSFSAEVILSNAGNAHEVRAQVLTLDDQLVGKPFSTTGVNGERMKLQAKLDNVLAWNPETPHLYKVKFDLYTKGELVHTTSTRFGFRTVEVRERDGIYVNGVKVKFKGVNHHSFWPESGRTTNKQMSIRDIQLMKDMNMNAVRTSHYPPDGHFLDMCDSLGMFVLDELAGWHDAYDTEIGTKLVREMVIHDVNHPSVVIWNNGNEGGHNPELDAVFGQYDIQNRLVIHPWEEFNGTATQHYRAYDYGVGTFWHGHKITFPTEFLHGLYDGGSGAGLYDYWELIWNNPIAAGGFLWVFADEGVVRTDQEGKVDTHGDKAADGILGAFHEKEASFYTIKEVWSPVQLTRRDITIDFDGVVEVENRYLYTNLQDCSFSWQLSDLPAPTGNKVMQDITGSIRSVDVPPGHKGSLQLELPADWQLFDVLYITTYGPGSEELYTHSWPIKLPVDIRTELEPEVKGKVTYQERENTIEVKAGSVEYTINKQSGLLQKVVNEQGEIPFNNGPFLSAGAVVFRSLEVKKKAGLLHIICSFDEKESRMKEFTWVFHPSGWVNLSIYYVPEVYDVHFDYMGVNFDYPEDLIAGVEWMGRGPYRVWKNRMHGMELGVHQKDYNNTMTSVYPVIYPEFKGYHANLYWARIQSKEQSFLVGSSSEDVFLRLFTPVQDKDPRLSPPFPAGDISFMQAIPPIGTKTNDPWNMGPQGKKNMFFDYGPYDSWRKRSKVMELYFDFTGK